MINYWSSILNGKQTKFAFQTYLYMYKSNHNYKWLNHIQSILNDCGMNYIWLQQFRNVPKNIAKMVKSRLLDQFLQAWNADLQLSAKGKNYALYKTNINPKSYLMKLHGAHLINMLKFRIVTINSLQKADAGTISSLRTGNVNFAQKTT